MNLLTTIPLDIGSDPVVGFIAIIGTVVIYVIWFAIDPKSAEKGMGNNKYNKSRIGMHTTRNRKNAERRRNRQIANMRSITAPNADGQYLYIFQANGLYKVGISNNPEYRSNQIRKKLNSPVGMMYIGKVRYGRTIDAETLVHRDLSQHNVPVDYNDGTTSPEWFGCSIGKVLSTCQKYADMH
jgi:hypothetical protein